MWGKKRAPKIVPFPSDGLDVVGETSFVANITAIRKAAGVDDDDRLTITAWLVAEPTNPHDSTAVAVAVPISGQAHVVGYLPRAAAAVTFPLVTAANKRGEIPSVRVSIGEQFEGQRGKHVYSVNIA